MPSVRDQRWICRSGRAGGDQASGWNRASPAATAALRPSHLSRTNNRGLRGAVPGAHPLKTTGTAACAAAARPQWQRHRDLRVGGISPMRMTTAWEAAYQRPNSIAHPPLPNFGATLLPRLLEDPEQAEWLPRAFRCSAMKKPQRYETCNRL